MSTEPPLSEEQLAALEAEMDRIHVDDVILQTVVSLINLAARRAGLAAPPGQGPAPDWQQVQTAIEGARALFALVEPRHGAELGQVRDALARLQMVYAQAVQAGIAPPVAPAAPESPPAAGPAPAPGAGAAGSPPPGPAQPGQPGPSGPAQRSGRLWIPGQ